MTLLLGDGMAGYVSHVACVCLSAWLEIQMAVDENGRFKSDHQCCVEGARVRWCHGDSWNKHTEARHSMPY